MIFSVGAGSAPDRGRLVAHTASRAPEQPACVTLKFESSHPGKSDSNFDVPGEDSAASSCAAVQAQKIAVQLACMDEKATAARKRSSP